MSFPSTALCKMVDAARRRVTTKRSDTKRTERKEIASETGALGGGDGWDCEGLSAERLVLKTVFSVLSAELDACLVRSAESSSWIVSFYSEFNEKRKIQTFSKDKYRLTKKTHHHWELKCLLKFFSLGVVSSTSKLTSSSITPVFFCVCVCVF